MSYTKGGLIETSFGKDADTDPRWTMLFDKTGIGFITVGGNDEANAKELLRRWNSHDDLLKACKRARNRLSALGQDHSYQTMKTIEAAVAKAEAKEPSNMLIQKIRELENGK